MIGFSLKNTVVFLCLSALCACKDWAPRDCAAAGVPTLSAGADLESRIALDARESLDRLIPKLSPAQLEGAEKVAERYIADYSRENANP